MESERIQEKISQLNELNKWEVLCWLEMMLEKAQIDDEEKSIKFLEAIIKKLPLVIILSLTGGIINNRCAIILVSIRNNEAKRVAEGVPTRHPLNKNFPITKLLKNLVVEEEDGIYIPNPDKNELVAEQRDLVKNSNITAIYFVKVRTLLGNIVLAMDTTGTKKGFSLDEREFLDTISRFLGRIEVERERLKMGLEKVAQETKINTLGFFTAAILHLFRNKITAIEGLCGRIGIDVKNGDNDRATKKSDLITREAEEIGKILHSLAELSHNLSKLGTLHLQNCSTVSIVDFISNISSTGVLTSFNNHCPDCSNSFFKTDQRKLEKAIVAIIEGLRQNKLPIAIDIYRKGKTFSVKIKQYGDNFQKLQGMQLLAKTYEIEALSVLSPEDLSLSAYLMVLPQISKTFQIEDDHLIITFDFVSFD